MEQNFQTSFIPKKPMVESRATSSRPIGIFTIISIFVFFAVILASGGLYFYKGVMAKNIASMSNDLTLAKARFEPEKINLLQILDKRLRASDTVLKSHITISPIFQALQDITMKSVRYTKFSYNIDEKNKVDIKMSGQTVGYGAYSAYASIAMQSDLFSKNKNLIDPVFSNLSLDEKGNVIFDLNFSVDSSFVDYKQALLVESDNSPSTNQTGGETTN